MQFFFFFDDKSLSVEYVEDMMIVACTLNCLVVVQMKVCYILLLFPVFGRMFI